MEIPKMRKLQARQQDTVYLKRNEMKTLEELAFQALIHLLRNLCSELKMENLSYLRSNLKSLSFAEHESCWTLPLLEELAVFAFDTLDYKLTQNILTDTVKLFEYLKNVTAGNNFKTNFLDTVKETFLHFLPESAISQEEKHSRKDANFHKFINVNEVAKFLRNVLHEFVRMNVQNPEYNMVNMPCFEYQKIHFQFLGVRKLCAYIMVYIDNIITNGEHFNVKDFSALEKACECIPQKLCDIIIAFLDSGLHKTRNEYIYNALKMSLNEKVPSKIYNEIIDLINKVVSFNIPFATKKKLTSLLNTEICTNLNLSDLELTSLVNVKDFTKLEVLSIHDHYFDKICDIQDLKYLKYLKITATVCTLSDNLSNLKYPNQLDAITLDGLVENKNILTNLFDCTPHLKQLEVSLKIPGGYVYIGQHLKELEELRIEHVDLYPKYKLLFLYLPDGMKKLMCNCIWSRWLSNLSSKTSHSISEVCFEELTCDCPLSNQLSSLYAVTLSKTTLKCHDLFINVGKQLTSLTLHNCSSVRLGCIAAQCPNLLNLKLVSCEFEDYNHLRSPQFPLLKRIYIAPVCKVNFCGWCLIAHSAKLEEIVALNPYVTSKCFDNFIDVNPLSQLKKFETRVGHQSWLTVEQAKQIVEKCKYFKVVKCAEVKKVQIQFWYYGLLEKIRRGVYVSSTDTEAS